MSFYNDKDKIKFAKCNKLISRGAKGSSSNKYQLGQILEIPISNINVDTYEPTDTVAISVNGARANRMKFNKTLIDLAISAKVTFITDNLYNRNRSFNIGEKEIADYLSSKDYIFNNTPTRGEWVPNSNKL